MRDRTGDLLRLALERLCRWIREHGQHFDGHAARTAPSPLYGVYQPGELVAVSLRLAARLLARFTQGGESTPLWEAWRAREWLCHDPDRLTPKASIQRRKLSVTLDEMLLQQVDELVAFLGGATDRAYIVEQALRRITAAHKAFQQWRSQRNHNNA